MIRKNRKAAFLIIGVLAVLTAGCGFFPEKIYTSSLFAMDTVMELQIAGKTDLTSEADNYIRSLEKELSVTDEESQVGRLNAEGEGSLSGEAAGILGRALDVCKRTGGALDVTIYPVLKAWGFTTGSYRVPSDSEINELLENVDYSKVTVEEKESGAIVYLPDGMQIDLGSVVKGYTGEAVAAMLREKGVSSALLNLGGNVQCIGTKPTGEKWKVAIKCPFKDSTSGVIGVYSADDVAIITSGGYERYFEEDGKTYWHILDPATGKPAESGLASVTIIGKDGLLCDGLSTALFVKGLEDAIEYYRACDDFEAIFITEDREVYVTEAIADDFTLTGEYHDLPLKVVSR